MLLALASITIADTVESKRDLITTWYCANKSDFLFQLEYRRNCSYLNRNMMPSVGIGFNLARSEAPGQLKLLKLDFNKVLTGATWLTNAQIQSLFEFDMQFYEAGATACVSSFSTQPTWIQQALIDISFSMSKNFLWTWTDLLTKLNSNDYSGAYAIITASDWCKKFPERCKRDGNLVKYW